MRGRVTVGCERTAIFFWDLGGLEPGDERMPEGVKGALCHKSPRNINKLGDLGTLLNPLELLANGTRRNFSNGGEHGECWADRSGQLLQVGHGLMTKGENHDLGGAPFLALLNRG